MAELAGRPDCCWVANAARTDFPELAGAQECDVVIVGAGIVGLTTALALLEAGKSVVVLEARRVGRQVTGRSSAKITAQHSLIYRYLIDTAGQEIARAYAEANRAAVTRFGNGSISSASTVTMSPGRLSPIPVIRAGWRTSAPRRTQPGSSASMPASWMRLPTPLRPPEPLEIPGSGPVQPGPMPCRPGGRGSSAWRTHLRTEPRNVLRASEPVVHRKR